MSKQLPPRARAVITGAGSGFGRAVSLELAARGARVLVTDLDLALAEETAALVAARGGEAHALAVDVTDAAQVEAAAVRYAGFGPHSGARGYHGAVAVQRQTADRRVHAFVGAAVEGRTARAEDTGAEEQLTTVGPIVGAGLSVGPVQLELSLAVPLGTLDHTGDPAAEVSSGAQLMLAVGVGLP